MSERRTHSRIQGAGFTLIEVLAALIIVSLGMLGVIQAVSQTASNTSYLRDKTIAHWVAMNRLTEVRLAATPPATDTSSGTAEMAGQQWRWTQNVTETDVESMLRIDINVAPADADEKSSLASVTGFFGTAGAPPGAVTVKWDLERSQPPTGTGTGTGAGTDAGTGTDAGRDGRDAG